LRAAWDGDLPLRAHAGRSIEQAPGSTRGARTSYEAPSPHHERLRWPTFGHMENLVHLTSPKTFIQAWSRTSVSSAAPSDTASFSEHSSVTTEKWRPEKVAVIRLSAWPIDHHSPPRPSAPRPFAHAATVRMPLDIRLHETGLTAPSPEIVRSAPSRRRPFRQRVGDAAMRAGRVVTSVSTSTTCHGVAARKLRVDDWPFNSVSSRLSSGLSARRARPARRERRLIDVLDGAPKLEGNALLRSVLARFYTARYIVGQPSVTALAEDLSSNTCANVCTPLCMVRSHYIPALDRAKLA
jgi:hypothetical protein